MIMAVMIDQRPLDTPGHWGEAEVWDALKDRLGEQIIVYNHRMVKEHELDFCLIIPGIGLAIIEVKGWTKKYIREVKGVDEIYLGNQEKPVKSPKKQARGYKFLLLNTLREQYDVTPLVLDLVCYPYLSEADYRSCRLDIVSEANTTIFKEDLLDKRKLGNKLLSTYNQLKQTVHDEMNEILITSIRKHFEPILQKTQDVIKDKNGYSVVCISNQSLAESTINNLLEGYFKGKKVYLFVNQKSDITRVENALKEKLQQAHIGIDRLNLVFDQHVEYEKVSDEKNSLRVFNFEVHYVSEQVIEINELNIVEGRCSEEEKAILRKIAKLTAFNSEQYFIEHADVDKNILIKAGAGTGKTYSMVSRVTYLCNRSNIPLTNLIDSVAMVTFTNEAADNMKRRLKQAFMNYFILTKQPKFIRLIEEVDQMEISTIHKFAKNVIKDAVIDQGLGRNFSISSSQYLKEKLYEKYLNDYVIKKKEANPRFYKEFKMPIYQLKKDLIEISSQLYNKSIDIKNISQKALGESIKSIPFFNELIIEVVVKAEEEYSKKILEQNKIELRQCMLLLNEVVECNYKEKCDLKYKYIFIDEFQDTDDIQIDTFSKLQQMIGFKLFIVGDLKQSIYRFRGATIEAFSKINTINEEWIEFALNINYRSDNRLLDRYDEIFTQMRKEDYLPNEKNNSKLTSNIESKLEKEKLIEVIEYCKSDEDSFYQGVVDEINKQKDTIKDLKSKEKLSNEEQTIAILVRENWQVDTIVKEAKKRGLEIETAVGGNLYKLAPAIDFYKLLLALNNPQEPLYLYNLIASNNIGLKINPHILHGKTKEEKREALVQILDIYYSKKLGWTWNRLIKELHNRPVLMVLKIIYDKTKPWKNYSNDKSQQHFYRINYELILEKIIKTHSIDYLTLNNVCNSMRINIVTKQEEMARSIEIEQDGIRVLCTTIHKSKGLEYGTVIVPYTNANIESIQKAEVEVVYDNHRLGYGIKVGTKKEFNSNYNQGEEKTQKAQEEARIFYVALTRAIRNIVWFKDLEEENKLSWKTFLEVR